MHLDYDYNGTPLVGLNSSDKDSLDSKQYIYVACLGIAEAKINIEGLLDWYNSSEIKGAAINRAELILPVADINGNQYNFPESLICFFKEDGTYYYLPDIVASNNWLGNKYDQSIKAYRIDMTSYLQRFVTNKYSECALYLIPDSRISSAKRVILNGPQSSNPPQLNIIYSHSAN